jgi:hypothetical protein
MCLDLIAGVPLLVRRTPRPDRAPVMPDIWTVEVMLAATVGGVMPDPPGGPSVPRPRSPVVDAALERSVDALFDPAPTATVGEVARDRPGLIRLSNIELSHAWRASYRALRIAEDPRDRARIAAARARYLDALQERDPAGFARWVSSEHAASRDPCSFLGPDRPSST